MALEPKKPAQTAVEPEVHALAVVVGGDFTPSLFQPAWLAAKGLIAEAEASAAKIEIIHPKATAFATDGFEVRVLENRFQVTTLLAPYFEVVRDLVLGIFTVLPEVPFRAVGLNHTYHYPLPSPEIWHEVGHKLAPKEHWNKALKEPGTLSLSIRSVRDDENDGYVQVRVEPSASVKNGLFIDINDHFQLTKPGGEPCTDTREIRDIISSRWDASAQRAQQVVSSLLSLAGIG